MYAMHAEHGMWQTLLHVADSLLAGPWAPDQAHNVKPGQHASALCGLPLCWIKVGWHLRGGRHHVQQGRMPHMPPWLQWSLHVEHEQGALR